MILDAYSFIIIAVGLFPASQGKLCNKKSASISNLEGCSEVNDSIAAANYARMPVKLVDPLYGIIDYTNCSTTVKAAVNASSTTAKPVNNTSVPLRTVKSNADPVKFAEVFAKAFAAGYSAANLHDNPTDANDSISFAVRHSVPVQSGTNTTFPVLEPVPNAYVTGYALAKQKKAVDIIKNSAKDFQMKPLMLPYRITSEAVGYGSAYGSGYMLAANEANITAFNNSRRLVPDSRLDSEMLAKAAAAGFAAYRMEPRNRRENTAASRFVESNSLNGLQWMAVPVLKEIVSSDSNTIRKRSTTKKLAMPLAKRGYSAIFKI